MRGNIICKTAKPALIEALHLYNNACVIRVELIKALRVDVREARAAEDLLLLFPSTLNRPSKRFKETGL